MSPPILLTSCLSTSTDYICHHIADYLAAQRQRPFQFVDSIDYGERAQRLKDGRIQLGWICGLLYTMMSEAAPTPPRLLAAPVSKHARYENKPVYFSDIIVRRESDFYQFDDLEGSRWAYNEATSFSGYQLMLARLSELGKTAAFFPKPRKTGSHLNSITAVLQGNADVAAIDSTVMDELPTPTRQSLRVIVTLGPNPVPPFVLAHAMPPLLSQQLQEALLHMHHTEKGKRCLAASSLSHFTAVTDTDYDQIRQISQQAQTIVRREPPFLDL